MKLCSRERERMRNVKMAKKRILGSPVRRKATQNPDAPLAVVVLLVRGSC